MTSPFEVFGPAHLAALAAVALISSILARVARCYGYAATPSVRLPLAAVGVASWFVKILVAWSEGWLTWQVGLPLHLCDLALVLAAAVLLCPSRSQIELLYFFAFAGTLPSLVWPEVHEGFPSFRFLIYFLQHGLVVSVAWMMIAGFALTPRRGSWWRVWLKLNLVAIAVTPVNLLLDTNFLFLRAKPSTASPIDFFGPWPIYLLVLEALAALFFKALELPFARSMISSKLPDRDNRVSTESYGSRVHSKQ